ncbi:MULTISPECIES: ParB family protein [Entomomonas]|uniref:ParB N-terminal domain-containing protein n=1 Tax=Entomomonas asaccharolytica TaxID=2785331 RepID=A0A974RY09_9GAMM|nr:MULTISPECIES: ParB family protein [Entomomonas]QQP86811.1 ParB N-terminal domain-containing protein [Entomomonas asaccharolytica]UYZ83571.1 ParB N-terminal domain-containing protein [Entomomonas sp. E2T0]
MSSTNPKNQKNLQQQKVTQSLMSKTFKRGEEQPGNKTPVNDISIIVTLDQLRAYDHNPRKSVNPKFAEIKESIRTRGLDQPPTITKRPDEEHYIIRNGGNTRLKALKELWTETGDQRFYRIQCLFKPWDGEIAALVGHLVENELHGELLFIDKAVAISNMREFYNSQANKNLSLRELAECFRKDGYPVSHTLVKRMLDCVEYIYPYIPELLFEGLGRPRVEELISLKNQLYKIWNKYIEDSNPIDPDDNEMFLGYWGVSLSKFNDLNVDDYNFNRIKDELLGDLEFYTGQEYRMLELDLLSLTKTKDPIEAETQAPTVLADPVKNATVPTATTETTGSVNTPLTTPTLTTVAKDAATQRQQPSTSDDGGSAAEAVILHNIAIDQPSEEQQLSTEEQQYLIEKTTVKPVTTSSKVQQLNASLEKSLGGELPVFKEEVVKSIPVEAGGGLAEVSNIWYISKQIENSPELIREEIFNLACDIAKEGNYQSWLIKTNEGLGFGMQPMATSNTDQSEAIGLLLTSLLRMLDGVQTTQALPNALFCQLLIGGYDIQIGNKPPEATGLERLSDVLLIKLFRLIRLARHLVDLIKEN